MTQSVTGPRTAPPTPRTPTSPHQPGPATAKSDKEAMAEAFAAARKRQGAALPLPEQAGHAPVDATPGEAPPPAPPAHGFPRWAASDYLDGDGQGERSGQGLGAVSAQPVPVTVQAPPVPPPAVDPSAFVQLMTQLWARENGKGAKDVRVQLGADSWPATGARLVRNAAGTLDVEVHFAPHHAPDRDTVDRLCGRFEQQGIALGAFAITDGA